MGERWIDVGLGIFFWVVQSALFRPSQTVHLTRAGVEERSYFGIRRLPWEAFGEVEYRSLTKQVENLKPYQIRRIVNLRTLGIYSVKDRDGREVFRWPVHMRPGETFQLMLRRTGTRNRFDRRSATRPAAPVSILSCTAIA